jgi:acetolactate synthase regulatory subunit
MSGPHRTLTVLVVLRDGPHALVRLLSVCHRRGWTPASLRATTSGELSEVVMRLDVQDDRRGAEHQVREQLGRLVDVEHVLLDAAPELPDDVAFASVRRRAPWGPIAAPRRAAA